MILFLYGKDTFRSRDYMRNMIHKFKKDRDPQGYNVAVFDATKDSSARILEEIGALPFLAEKRLVVIEHLLQSKQADLQAALQKKIEEQTIPSSTVLLIWEGVDAVKGKGVKELFERLKTEKYAQEFSVLEGQKLQAWIAAEVKDRGGNISHDAIQFLVANLGADMWQISAVIDQMVAYKNGEEIAVKDVKEVVEQSVDDNIFSLIDAIVQKKQPVIFSLLEEQYRQGNDAGYIFAMLLRQFRIMLEIKDALNRDKGSEASLAKELGVHPFVIKKSVPLTQKYTMEELSWVYDALLTFDIDIKTGKGNPKALLDIFIGKLCDK